MVGYTNCDIEVHLTNLVDGMDTTGMDEEASNAKGREVVEEALTRAYPERSVYVHMDYRIYGPSQIINNVEDIDDAAIQGVIDGALADCAVWIVESTDA